MLYLAFILHGSHDSPMSRIISKTFLIMPAPHLVPKDSEKLNLKRIETEI